MTLQEYFKALPRGSKTDLAKAVGVSRTWVSLLLSGRARCSPYLAKAIEDFTKGAVKREELRPDVFGEAK